MPFSIRPHRRFPVHLLRHLQRRSGQSQATVKSLAIRLASSGDLPMPTRRNPLTDRYAPECATDQGV